jgi:hypothetical protein
VGGREGIAVLVVHHLRQMPADDPLEAISGSNGLVGGMDGALVLNRERGRADAFLYVDGRDIEEPQELALRWDPNVASWTLIGDADEYRLSEARTEIICVLEEHGAAMTPTEVADVLGKNNDAVRQTLRRMAADGQLTASDGRYGMISHPGHSVTEGEAA